MANFKNTEIGKLSEIGTKYENGKAFLHDILGLTSCEISVNEMPKGVKLPFSHKHKQNKEVYIFIKGNGTMTIDGETFDVKEGSCVKVLPEAARTMEAKEDMQYICVQAKAGSLEQFAMSDGELC